MPPSDRDDISLNNMVTTAPQCGSSNMFPGSMEINAMNYSLNGSASGSNHMSNGHNGNSKAVNAGVKNMDCDAGVAANGEAGGTSLVDQNRFSQREVALNKFRQKRKERNFGKKVTGFQCHAISSIIFYEITQLTRYVQHTRAVLSK